jgi:hypothetical protein
LVAVSAEIVTISLSALALNPDEVVQLLHVGGKDVTVGRDVLDAIAPDLDQGVEDIDLSSPQALGIAL